MPDSAAKMKFVVVFALVSVCILGAMAFPYEGPEETPLRRVARGEILKNRKYTTLSGHAEGILEFFLDGCVFENQGKCNAACIDEHGCDYGVCDAGIIAGWECSCYYKDRSRCGPH